MTVYDQKLCEAFIEEYSFKQNKYSEIESRLCINRDITRELYLECRTEIERIQKIRNKFTGQRRIDFGSDFRKFYDWYQSQIQNGAHCNYCGITQNELDVIFREEEILPLNDAIKRSSGSLEIERKDSSSNSYGSENIILACPLCNNAKSNLINEKNWRTLFVPAMREYYKKLLGKDLSNPVPEIKQEIGDQL